MTRFASSTALLLLVVPSLVLAGSYQAIDDATLIARADGIAVVVPLAQQSFVSAEGLILTDHVVAVEEGLKGVAGTSSTIVIREVGGTVGNRSLTASTAPRFVPGMKTLVFLSRLAPGTWSTYSGAYGKFDFAHDDGATLLVREAGEDEIFGDERGPASVRTAEGFLAYIRETVARGGVDAAAVAELEAPIQPDSASVASEGADVWNDDPTSEISIVISGAAPDVNIGPQDGLNTASFNLLETFSFQHPSEGPITPLAGAAVGYALLWHVSTPHTAGDESYVTSIECDIILQAGLSESALASATAHELGHCLGFRHSNEVTTDVALMRATIPIGAFLRDWDKDAANQVYGDGTLNPASVSGADFMWQVDGAGIRWPSGSFTMKTFVACNPPAITMQPTDQAVPAGETVTLTVAASAATSYQWYEGGSPETGTAIPGATSASYTTPPVVEQHTYSVRAANACGSADSRTATVSACEFPTITAQPQDATILSGDSATLSVGAADASDYQWYRGASGSTANRVVGARGATLVTGALTATTSFWVQVRNDCGNVNSQAATVTVNASCTEPQITAQTQAVTVLPGESATLTVAAIGTSLQYQWFEGSKGDVGRPIAGATGAVYVTPALNALAHYWVRITNSCGTAESATIPVSVQAACTPPAIAAQPQPAVVAYGATASLSVDATGTDLRYQWFAGASGDDRRPFDGANQASFTTPPLRANSQFWARVSNGCGGAHSETAVVTLEPEVVVTTLPDAIVQTPDSGGATSSMTLTNIGGTQTTVALARQGDFFTIDSTVFELAAGASRQVTLTGAARPSGSYGGSVLVSGAGVPPGVVVPVIMLVTAPSLGQVEAIPDENRVDIGAPAEQEVVEASVGFTNHGDQPLTGMVTADVPWIEIPEPLVMIAPGQRITIRFLIHRSRRADGDAPFGSTIGNLSLQYLAGSGAGATAQLVEALGETGVSKTLVTVTDTAKPKTKVGAPPPLLEGEIAMFAASLGHVQSPVGTFISDVYLSTLRPMGAISVYYTGAGMPLSTSVAALVPSLSTLRPIAFTDLTKTVFEQESGLGTLQIRGVGIADLKISASVFNKSNAAGTYGSAVPVLRSDRGVRSGESMFITGLLESSAAGRTNLMVQELSGNDALIAVDLLDASGNVIATKEDVVPAFQHIRMPDFVPPGVASAVVRTRGGAGSVLAYATPLDALSGDTWVVTDWPRVQGFDAAARQIIPIAGKLEGANANYFRSETALVNQGTATADVIVRFVANTGTVSERTVAIPPRGTIRYDDTISDLFGLPTGLGFLEIDPQGSPVVVTSRTFATIGDDPRTFGTGVPAVASTAMKAGETERISGFDDADQAVVTAKTPATFRTNLGLVETSGKGVTVRVTVSFRHAVSTTVTMVGAGKRDFALAPRQFLLLPGIAAQVLGDQARAMLKGNLKDLFADIEIVEGDGEVIAFTSSVDNGTGDQLFKLE